MTTDPREYDNRQDPRGYHESQARPIKARDLQRPKIMTKMDKSKRATVPYELDPVYGQGFDGATSGTFGK